jgi:hypothetical protein
LDGDGRDCLEAFEVFADAADFGAGLFAGDGDTDAFVGEAGEAGADVADGLLGGPGGDADFGLGEVAEGRGDHGSECGRVGAAGGSACPCGGGDGAADAGQVWFDPDPDGGDGAQCGDGGAQALPETCQVGVDTDFDDGGWPCRVDGRVEAGDEAGDVGAELDVGEYRRQCGEGGAEPGLEPCDAGVDADLRRDGRQRRERGS